MSASPLTALVDRFVGANEFTGAAVVAYHRGALVCEYYAGHAAPGIPATADTIWPLASISKVYSAATMMRADTNNWLGKSDWLFTPNSPNCRPRRPAERCRWSSGWSNRRSAKRCSTLW